MTHKILFDDQMESPLVQEKQPLSPSYSKQAILVESLNVLNKKTKKHILKNVSIEANFGEITAIMGPSGSGKTTLLRYIAKIFSNNLLYQGKRIITGRYKYVAQDDHLHGFLTVNQYINNYFGLNYGFSNIEERDALKNKIISEMRLNKAQNTKVGDVFLQGLSGGEKRRLSVALELVSKPSVLILDEPTSGLDSFAAEKVMESLSTLVEKENIAVVLTIHQPSSRIVNMIGKLILVKEGEILFHDKPENLSSFFASQNQQEKMHYNPIDQAIEILCEEHTIKKVEYVRSHSVNEMERVIRESIVRSMAQYHKKATLIEKFLFLTHRNFLNLLKNPGVIIVRVIMYSAFCFICGAMYFNLGSQNNQESIQSRCCLLFFTNAFLVFMSIAAVPAFIMERVIVEKELKNRLYHPFIFQISNWFTSWFGTFFIALISSMLIIFMTQLNGFGWYLGILFMALMIAENIAFMAALLIPHYIIAMAIMAGIYATFFLCAGFAMVKREIPSYFIWVYYLSFMTHSFRAMMNNEYDSDSSFVGIPYASGRDVLDFYSMEDDNKSQDLIILFAYVIGTQLIIFIIMRVKYQV